MKARWSIVAAVAAAGVFAAAPTARAQAPQGVADAEIVLGMQTDISGPAATWGVAVRNGIQMRFDEENARGGVNGRRIRFIVEDSQYQVPRAVQAVNKLINRDRVFAMIGNIGTPMNNAVFADQFAANIPNMFPFSGARSMYEPFHRLKFAALPSYYGEVRSAVRHFVRTAGKSRVCALYQDTEFGQEMFEGARDETRALGLPLVETATNRPTDTDLTAQVTRLRNANCDLVVLGTIVRDTIIAYTTARRMGWNVDMVGTLATFDLNVSAAANNGTEGFFATSSIDAPYADSPNAAVRAWVEAYRARYNAAPNPPAQLGYVYADLVIRGLQGAGRALTTDTFIQAMERIADYQDPFGGPRMSFGPQKRLGTEVSSLYQVRGGRWERIVTNITTATQ